MSFIVLDKQVLFDKMAELKEEKAQLVKKGLGYPAMQMQTAMMVLDIILDSAKEIDMNGLKEIQQQNEEAQRVFDEQQDESVQVDPFEEVTDEDLGEGDE